MALNIGNSKIGSLYLGSTKIDSAYLGSTKLYQVEPAIGWDGFIFQFKWSPVKDENITVHGLKADDVALTISDIEQGKYNNGGAESSMTSSEISDALTGNLTKYCRSIEFWIKKPDAGSLSWITNQYYQPPGTVLVNIWRYALNGNRELVVEDKETSIELNSTYTFNV